MERHGQWRRVVIEKCRGDFGREGRRAERARRGVPRRRCRRRSASLGRRVEPMHSHPIIDVRGRRARKSSRWFPRSPCHSRADVSMTTADHMLFGSAENQTSQQSLRAFDWLNFFLAGVLTGFGPFMTLHLAGRGSDASRNRVRADRRRPCRIVGPSAGRRTARHGPVETATGRARGRDDCLFGPDPGGLAELHAGARRGAAPGRDRRLPWAGSSAISLGLVGIEPDAGAPGAKSAICGDKGFATAGLMGLLGYLFSDQLGLFCERGARCSHIGRSRLGQG